MSPGDESPLRRVRVLINPHSGLSRSFGELQEVFERYWGNPEIDLSYQFSRSAEDGQGKARRAIDDGVDTILVAGGDGMVNSIGSVLVDTSVALGVIPTGSGNGFARHFNIPLIPQKAVQALAYSKRQRIDVGLANGQPFFVTCSMAWDAAIVRTFEKSPIRGMLPYVLAGAVEQFGQIAQQPGHVFSRKHNEFKKSVVRTGIRCNPRAAAELGQVGHGKNQWIVTMEMLRIIQNHIKGLRFVGDQFDGPGQSVG